MRAPSCCDFCLTTAPPLQCRSSPMGVTRMNPQTLLARTPRTEHLINELQSHGVRLVDPKAGVESRRGGAGPSDHKAITIDGMTVMIPVHTAPAFESPYVAEAPDRNGNSRIVRSG